MQTLAYRSLYLTASSSHQTLKQLTCLSKIAQIVYPDRSSLTLTKDKKPKCWLCNRVYEHVLMLILHVEMLHQGEVQVYRVKGEVLGIVAAESGARGRSKEKEIGHGFIRGLTKTSTTMPYSSGPAISSTHTLTSPNPAHLKNKPSTRQKTLLESLLLKLDRPILKHEQLYFHSNNIFKPIHPAQLDHDSQQQIGEVERELQKLRIEDFSDVNDNDKKFFVLWNGFVHQKRKKMGIVYLMDLPGLFWEFAGIAFRAGVPRINLVMHAWTLWSVGQIGASDVIKGLNQYDQAQQEKNSLSVQLQPLNKP